MILSVDIHQRLGDFALSATFDAPTGITVLFGRSGAGKTAIINAVAGLSKPDTGRIRLQDKPLFDHDRSIWLPPHKRRIGYVFQEGRLFPHLTVAQNLNFGRWFAPKGEPRENPHTVIEMLGIGNLLDRRPTALSGGEKARVALGRALLSAPQMVLADEPLAALDEARKEDILPYFERLRDEVSIPVLYVSHSASEVARLATTVVALEAGQVTHVGPATEVLGDPAVTPLGPREAGALLNARFVRQHADGLTELQAGGCPLFIPSVNCTPGQTVRVRIAAHDVILSRKMPEQVSALNILKGTVLKLRDGAGPGVLISLQTQAGTILARVTRRSAKALGLAPGAECHAMIKTVAVARGNIGGTGTRDEGGTKRQKT